MAALSEHLAFTQLADLAEERMIADSVIAAHLAVCPRCSADLAWLQQTLRYLRSLELETPPSATTERLKALFRQRRPAGNAIVVGTLQFDSRRDAPAFAVRSASRPERQVIVQFPDLTVDLRISPSADDWQVLGQVLPADATAPLGGRVELLGLNGSSVAPIDDLGEFALAAVRSGVYRCTLVLGTQALIIPQMELGT